MHYIKGNGVSLEAEGSAFIFTLIYAFLSFEATPVMWCTIMILNYALILMLKY